MRRRLKRFLRIGILLLMIAAALLVAFRIKYRRQICELAETQVVNTTSDLINDAIDTQMEAEDIQYDRIVYFEKDLNGQITALKTNMSEVNRLKTAILNRINDEILALDTSQLGIRMGSLIFPEFLGGRGPSIPIEIISIRNSDASFFSSFTEAGINQTLQQLSMEIRVDIAVLVLGQTNTFTVSSQVVIAETIIVGRVPDTFFQTGGNYGSEKQN